MAKKLNWLPLIVAVVAVMFLNFMFSEEALPPQSVAEIQGTACVEATDCPCWGMKEIAGTNVTAYGIGHGLCTSGTCDMQECLAIEPAAEWVRDNSFAWLRGDTELRGKQVPNLLIAAILIGVGIFAMFLPKG